MSEEKESPVAMEVASADPVVKTEITVSAGKNTEQEATHNKIEDDTPAEDMTVSESTDSIEKNVLIKNSYNGVDVNGESRDIPQDDKISAVSENDKTDDPTDVNLDKVVTQQNDFSLDSKPDVICDIEKTSLKEEDETNKEEKKENGKMEIEAIAQTEIIIREDRSHKTKQVKVPMAYRVDEDSSGDEADSSNDSDSSTSTTSGSDLEEPKHESVSDRYELF